MLSHHTIGHQPTENGFNSIRDLFGVEIFASKPVSGKTFNWINPDGSRMDIVDFWIDNDPIEDSLKTTGSMYKAAGTDMVISNDGLMVNYPFKVGKKEDKIKVPINHSLGLFGYGKVWLEYENPKGIWESHVGEGDPDNWPEFKEITKSPKTGRTGTNNFFVHTYNNTAIINSGHSFPEITTEEVRIIANTLYYLSQVTTNTSWNDRMSQDLENPLPPTLKSFKIDKDKITVNIDPAKDLGSTYEHYIEGTGSSDGKKYTSNTTKTTITTGVKGYSYIIDNNPTTNVDSIIDITTEEFTTSNVNYDNPILLHVRSIDNAGNISDVSHISLVDKSIPTATHTISPKVWTNGSVDINLVATDNTGVNRIQLPNNSFVNSDKVTYNVTSNNNYIFFIEDFLGNILKYKVEITNIDKVKPYEPNIILTGSEIDNSRAFRIDNIYDEHSGVNKVEYKIGDKDWKGYNMITKPSIPILDLSPGLEISVRVIDNVLNSITKTLKTNLNIIDIEIPINAGRDIIIPDGINNVKFNLPINNRGTPVDIALRVEDTEGIPLTVENPDWSNMKKDNSLSKMTLKLKSNTANLKPGYKDNITIHTENMNLLTMDKGNAIYIIEYLTGFSRKSDIIAKYNFNFIVESIYK